MSEQSKLVTRQELYEAVWARPITTLAQEWNTTPAQVVRACEEMEVPRPGAGHWQMIARGYVIQREPLAEPTKDAPAEAVLIPPDSHARSKRAKVQQTTSSTGEPEEPAAGASEPAKATTAPTAECDLPKAVERAVLDMIRQATEIDFWEEKLTEFHFPSSLGHWLGVGSKIAESKLVKALRSARKDFRSFEVTVQERPYRYDSAETGLEIGICLRDGYEWKDAWEEAWTLSERPNDRCLSDNALLLYRWAKGPKNTGKITERKKIGAQAKLRRTYSDMDKHLEEIRLKADPSIQWEKGENGWRAPLRIWFETREMVYYHYGPLNPAMRLDVSVVAHPELERLKEWLHAEILKPGFPDGTQVVGIFDIRDRKTLNSVFSKLPESCGRYGGLPAFFKALRVMDGIELQDWFEQGGGPWLVICQPQKGMTWEEVKARLKAKAQEIPLEERYSLSEDSLALLQWIVNLRSDEYLKKMTPLVEDRLEREIGIEGDWDKENWGSYLQVLVEEINERTDFRLRAVPWRYHGEWHTRILVKKKEPDLEIVVRAIQAFGLSKNKLLEGDKVRAAISGLIAES